MAAAWTADSRYEENGRKTREEATAAVQWVWMLWASWGDWKSEKRLNSVSFFFFSVLVDLVFSHSEGKRDVRDD